MIKQETSYSIWLRPSQAQIDELTNIISRLSHRYRSIVFPPHITLVPNISAPIDSIKKVCGQIVEEYQAFDITLNEITYSNKYFMNLYVLAELNNSLKSLHKETEMKLNTNTSEAFTPHISLMYAKPDIKRQQALKEELENKHPKIFSCQRIDIYNSTGKENEWYFVAAYPLKS